MSFSSVIGTIVSVFDTLLIYINAMIYDIISFLYQTFIAISSAQIFTSDQYKRIASNVYIVIGVVALFLIAYGLLRSIIDPDGSGKSETAPSKMVPKVITSIVIIAIVPTVFNFAYRMQEAIIGTDIIPKIILGEENYDEATNTYDDGTDNQDHKFSYSVVGRALANDIWTGFFYPNNMKFENGVCVENCANEIEINKCYFPAPNCDGIDDTSGLGLISGRILGAIGGYFIGTAIAAGTTFISGGTGAVLGIAGGIAAGGKVGHDIEAFFTNGEAYTLANAILEVEAGTKNFQVYANFGEKIHNISWHFTINCRCFLYLCIY